MFEYNIRRAEKQDCDEIYRLIKELADFEKMPKEVKISAKDLERDGFEIENPPFKCLVVDDPGQKAEELPRKLVGYALYSEVYGTWVGKRYWLEDIMVTEKHRGQGLGRQLFKVLCREALRNNIIAIKYVVLDWNPANEFYKKLGGVNTSKTIGWQYSELPTESIIKLAELNKEIN